MGRRARKRHRPRRPVRSHRVLVIKRWRYVVAYSVLIILRLAVGFIVFALIYWSL